MRVRELNLQTSYLFDINCHFHAVYVTLLNIKVHLKLYFFSLEFPFKMILRHALRHLEGNFCMHFTNEIIMIKRQHITKTQGHRSAIKSIDLQ